MLVRQRRADPRRHGLQFREQVDEASFEIPHRRTMCDTARPRQPDFRGARRAPGASAGLVAAEHAGVRVGAEPGPLRHGIRPSAGMTAVAVGERLAGRSTATRSSSPRCRARPSRGPPRAGRGRGRRCAACTVTSRAAATLEDLAQLGDAAHLGGARLDEVHGACVHQPGEVQQRRHVLARGERDAARGAQPRRGRRSPPAATAAPPASAAAGSRSSLRGLAGPGRASRGSSRRASASTSGPASSRAARTAGGSRSCSLTRGEPGVERLPDARADARLSP